MVRYYNTEDAKNLVRIEIENRKSALTFYDEIIQLVKKFDGKILNKRFDTALKQIDERLSYSRQYNSFSIEMSCWKNRSCRSTETDSYGYSHTIYISTEKITLNAYIQVYSYSHGEKEPCMLDNERIIAEPIIEALNKGKAGIEKNIEALENSIDKVQEYKERCEALKRQMKEITKDIPHLVKDYFDINYRFENN